MKTKGKRTSQADKSDFERRLSEPMGLPYSPEEFEELKKGRPEVASRLVV